MVKMIMTYSPTWPKAGTQNYMILMWMRKHGAITPIDALNDCRCFRLSERCRELEKLGWKLERGWFKTAGGARVRTYRLK